MGERYADIQALAVLVLVPFYAALWEGRDVRPLFIFLLAYVAMCVRNRAEGLLRRRQMPICHSRYTGVPRLMGQLPGRTELEVKRYAEPGLVLLVGGALCTFTPPLGVYLMLAAGGLFVSVMASGVVDRQHLLDLNDLMIENQARAEQIRAMRGDEP
ncbi:hypothetical protein [Tautonia sociabilis]|uniref:Uncharacterized protein n=1 Tax=Tautonia sociabilis TaxID=2080755 RepID=A0A432MQU1_9BACT|nr:hypothetical protein [Tautonia sociabilis]RUL89426.1 hypothetical protein TsocGM_01250 [Tautonia sociabilis]